MTARAGLALGAALALAGCDGELPFDLGFDGNSPASTQQTRTSYQATPTAAATSGIEGNNSGDRGSGDDGGGDSPGGGGDEGDSWN